MLNQRRKRAKVRCEMILSQAAIGLCEGQRKMPFNVNPGLNAALPWRKYINLKSHCRADPLTAVFRPWRSISAGTSFTGSTTGLKNGGCHLLGTFSFHYPRSIRIRWMEVCVCGRRKYDTPQVCSRIFITAFTFYHALCSREVVGKLTLGGPAVNRGFAIK